MRVQRQPQAKKKYMHIESLNDIANMSTISAAFFDENLKVSCDKFLLSHIFTHVTVDLGLILVFFVGTLIIPESTVVLEKWCSKLYVYGNFLFFSVSILVTLSKVIFFFFGVRILVTFCKYS